MSERYSPVSRSHRSAKSLSQCSRVSTDAYRKAVEDMLKSREDELKISSAQKKLMQEAEQREAEKRLREKTAILASVDVVKRQIELKQQLKLQELQQQRHEYNAVIESMPADLINVYPRITETPAEVRRAQKARKEAELKRVLLDEISLKQQKKSVEKRDADGKELETMARKEAEERGKEELAKAEYEANMQQYKEELMQEMEFRRMKQMSERPLEVLDPDRRAQLQGYLLAKSKRSQTSVALPTGSSSPSNERNSPLVQQQSAAAVKSEAPAGEELRLQPAETESQFSVCSVARLKPFLSPKNLSRLSGEVDLIQKPAAAEIPLQAAALPKGESSPTSGKCTIAHRMNLERLKKEMGREKLRVLEQVVKHSEREASERVRRSEALRAKQRLAQRKLVTDQVINVNGFKTERHVAKPYSEEKDVWMRKVRT